MQKQQIRNMTITALFIAIFLLQTFVPNIGYLRLLPTLPAITTIPLTMAIYALLMGPVAGSFFGLFWGVMRIILAYTQPGDMVSLMLFRNPLIALTPSILAGLLPGLIGRLFAKSEKKGVQKMVYLTAGAVTSLTNTVVVIVLTSIIFMGQSAKLIGYIGGDFANSTPLIWVLIIALGTNGLIEAIFTAIVTPLIVVPLQKMLHRLN